MFENSRTAKSIKNAKIALFFYFVNLILQFFSRKIFLEYLGAEVLGLNTTVQNLLGFLNIAELGISSAISYTLYQPLFNKDKGSINEIVSIQGWLYRKIAFIVIAGGCVLMLFFPLIFAKIELPIWYAYSSFIVLLVSALLGYFVNYRQIVLVADQKEYKVTFCIQGGKVLKVVLQITAIALLIDGYLYWLVIELLMSFVIAIMLNRTVRKEYAWLDTEPLKGKYLKNKYPKIIKKTKQLFIHRIAAFVLSQTGPLIIYAYASLTLVAIYGNYMLIIGGVTLLVNAVFNGISAGVGNLVAEGNKKHIKAFYWECVASRYWFASLLCFCLFMLTDAFIRIWVGEAYVLPHATLGLLIIYAFIVFTRVHDLFIAAYGIYQDVWAPALEASLNIGCSIWLGYYWGVNGIIVGISLSLFIVVFCWKPYFLFRVGFGDSIKEYVKKCIKYLLLISLSSLSSFYIINAFIDTEMNTLMKWMINASFFIVIYIAISSSLFFISDSGFRNFFNRIMSLVKLD